MKLSEKQLRRVVEGILQEMPKPGPPTYAEKPENDLIGQGIEDLCQAAEDQWMKLAEGDPSIEHDGAVRGFDDWRKQVSKATTELWQRVEEVVEEIDRRLTDGEFWDGE